MGNFMGYNSATELFTAIGNKIKAKQNAISDLETIRSGAAKGATAVQPATMTEALSAKQNSLSGTQLAAVNSGIDNTKVQQIGVNQTNILYNMKNGVQNIAEISEGTGDSQTFFIVGKLAHPVEAGGKVHISLSYTQTTANKTRIQLTDINNETIGNSIWFPNTSGTISQEYIVPANSAAYGYTVKNDSSTPTDKSTVTNLMICTPESWAQNPNYQPPALPNSDLTGLEAEDRAALAEEIDAGAKNKLKINSYTCTGSEGRYGRDDTLSIPAGDYVLIAKVNQTANSAFTLVWNGTQHDFNVNGAISNTVRTWDVHATSTITSAWIYFNATNDSWTDVMLCTKAAFGVSPKFVAYNTMAQWTKVEKEYTSTAADTMEYCGVSFTVPANQIYEFIVMDRYNAGNPKGLGVADNSTNYNSNSTVIAENMADFYVSAAYPWARQLTGMTVPRSQDTRYHIWVKRGSASKNTVYLMYRRIL